jgi:hypothetical protein
MARDVLSGGRRLCRAYGEKRQRVDRSVTNPGNAAALCPPGMGAEATLLRGGRVDDRPHFGYLVRRKASTLRVFTDHDVCLGIPAASREACESCAETGIATRARRLAILDRRRRGGSRRDPVPQPRWRIDNAIEPRPVPPPSQGPDAQLRWLDPSRVNSAAPRVRTPRRDGPRLPRT